ncbi:MAG: glycosyltransferase family 39 protein [Litorimonas sp.]
MTLPADTRWRDLLLLSLIGLIAFLPGLASLPPIDRDEARYMQATVQMVETGDLVDIRFQDDARHKKPAGSYWAQVGSLALTGQLDDVRRGERSVWAHRLPSVVGALIAVWATYLGGLALFGRREARLGAGLLAVSVSLVFEAHIAKTDAMLAGAAAVVLYGIAARRAWPVWLGLAAGMLLKGPVLLGLAGLALASDAALSRSTDRVRALLRPLPVLAALLIALPWFVAIGLRTDGAFFAEALGRDFGGKIASAQETHGGPPGYYALTTWVMFWPGALALPVAALFAWRTRTEPSTRLLLAWIVPMWILLEFVPTKLPHYTLPLYPALALLAAAGWVRLERGKAAWAGLVIAALIGLVLSVAVSAAASTSPRPGPDIWIAAGLGVLSLLALDLLWRGRKTAGPLAAALFIGAGFAALSRSPLLDLSPRLVAAAPEGVRIVSPDYREPSLVFLAGTDTGLTRTVLAGDLLVIETGSPPPACAPSSGRIVAGTNYAKGDRIALSLWPTDGCSQDELDRWAMQDD